MITSSSSSPLQKENVNRKEPILVPYDQVMPKFRRGLLKTAQGKKVTNPKQAVAIQYSEKEAADKGKKEYKPKMDVAHKILEGASKKKMGRGY